MKPGVWVDYRLRDLAGRYVEIDGCTRSVLWYVLCTDISSCDTSCNDFDLCFEHLCSCTVSLVCRLPYTDVTISKVLFNIINLEQCHSTSLNLRHTPKFRDQLVLIKHRFLIVNQGVGSTRNEHYQFRYRIDISNC